MQVFPSPTAFLQRGGSQRGGSLRRRQVDHFEAGAEARASKVRWWATTLVQQLLMVTLVGILPLAVSGAAVVAFVLLNH